MRTALHSHSVEEEDVPVYGPPPIEAPSSSPAYPTFSSTAQHVDLAINQAMSGFDHRGSPIAHNEASDGHYYIHNSRPQSQSQALPAPPHIPNNAPPGQFDMQPPPATTHPSWQALHDYAQLHASAHGYALSINTTAKNRARIKLACVCYGAPKNTHKLTPATRVRKNRVSYKTGCRMWVEGKKQEDGTWQLRIGEPVHNHPGRSIEGWAVQRKRTWGLQGGRIGVGGVTAKEEQQKLAPDEVEEENLGEEDIEQPLESHVNKQKAEHSLERGGPVWRIVEQEMLCKGGSGQGRDRGVGRTVKILEERLPGIHIFKRDVYNIRAQIKRARKAAGQELGEGLNDSEPDEDLEQRPQSRILGDLQQLNLNQDNQFGSRTYPEIDPNLIAQCNDALKTVTQQEESELERLRREVQELRQALAQRTKELEVKTSETESLRVQVEIANMALYNERDAHGHRSSADFH